MYRKNVDEETVGMSIWQSYCKTPEFLQLQQAKVIVKFLQALLAQSFLVSAHSNFVFYM